MSEPWCWLGFVVLLGLPCSAQALPVVRFAGIPSPEAADSLVTAQDEGHSLVPPDSQAKTTIRVLAHGLRRDEGPVRMSLFDSAEGFPEHGEVALQWGFARVNGDQAWFDFDAVPPGRYAVAVFHDEDGNGAMRKDWIGRPKEGWGVSQDAKGHFGPPHFEDASFEALGDTLTIHVHLRY